MPSNENPEKTMQARADADLLDSYDEELEMELDDDRLDQLLSLIHI